MCFTYITDVNMIRCIVFSTAGLHVAYLYELFNCIDIMIIINPWMEIAKSIFLNYANSQRVISLQEQGICKFTQRSRVRDQRGR